MKIRTGFVSNSSSSSFIVYFKTVPKTKEELQTILFADRQEYHSPYYDDAWPTSTVADIVWKDMLQNKAATLKKVKETVRNGYPINNDSMVEMVSQFVKYNQMPNFFDDKYRLALEDPKNPINYNKKLYEEDLEKWFKEYEKQLDLKAIKEKRAFIFHYGDEDGALYSAMEHGGLFKKLKYHTISNH